MREGKVLLHMKKPLSVQDMYSGPLCPQTIKGCLNNYFLAVSTVTDIYILLHLMETAVPVAVNQNLSQAMLARKGRRRKRVSITMPISPLQTTCGQLEGTKA